VTGGGLRPRVLLITGSLGRGGTELAVAALAQGLARRGRYTPIVAVLARAGELGTELRRRRLVVHELGIAGPIRSPGAVSRLLRLPRLVRSERAALVHTFLFDADVYGMLAARLGRPRAVVTTRRAIKWDKPRHLRGYRWTNRWVDRIVANSERVRRFTVEHEGAPADKVVTIPNGVDRTPFEATRPGRFRTAQGLAEDAFLVVAVGSLKRVKGQDVLLEAASGWLRRTPEARLVLAGDRSGRFAEELLARAAELGVGAQVLVPGTVDDVPALLADADLFVLPSRSEGMSNALLEAMASGLPVLATDVGGSRECLDGGACGVLVPADAPGALGEALESLAADAARRRELGRRARERVAEHYDLERMLDSVERLYRELLA
jgi:glycosyltransferase involved in cell wall biosynthesis